MRQRNQRKNLCFLHFTLDCKIFFHRRENSRWLNLPDTDVWWNIKALNRCCFVFLQRSTHLGLFATRGDRRCWVFFNADGKVHSAESHVPAEKRAVFVFTAEQSCKDSARMGGALAILRLSDRSESTKFHVGDAKIN